MEINGAVTVITGGGSGIGRSLALALAREGAELALADIDLAAAEDVAKEVQAIGRRALAIRTDVAQESDIMVLADRVAAELGPIDIFASNAGVVLGGSVEEVTDTDWQWIMGINFYAHIYAVRHVLPRMLLRDRGLLLHTASAAGLINTGTNIPYHVSKHAVVALAGGLAIDLAARGSNVKVSVICPEVVSTNLPQRSFQAGEIGKELSESEIAARNEVSRAMTARMAQRGLDPDEAARVIVAGIQEDRYLIYTHERTHAIVAGRAQDPEQGNRDAVRVLQREQERMQRFTQQAQQGGV